MIGMYYDTCMYSTVHIKVVTRATPHSLLHSIPHPQNPHPARRKSYSIHKLTYSQNFLTQYSLPCHPALTEEKGEEIFFLKAKMFFDQESEFVYYYNFLVGSLPSNLCKANVRSVHMLQ